MSSLNQQANWVDISEISPLLMHEIYYDKCQPQIGKIHYIDTDGGFFSFISNKLIADSKIYVRFKLKTQKNYLDWWA